MDENRSERVRVTRGDAIGSKPRIHAVHAGRTVGTHSPCRFAGVSDSRAQAAGHMALPQPAPGAWVYMDFAGPLIPSAIHRYVAYCGTVDPGSGYGRAWPCHHLTAAVVSLMHLLLLPSHSAPNRRPRMIKLGQHLGSKSVIARYW